MILAAHQPQFCPWLGYFDKLRRCDIFVFLDDVQFKKNEWQNRNRIKTAQGAAWMTVPVLHDFGQKISQVQVNNSTAWQKKLQNTIWQSYHRVPAFDEANEFLRELFEKPWERLVDINLLSIRWLAEIFHINTKTILSSELRIEAASTARLVELCRHFGADTYLAGAGGREYMDLSLFEKAGIRVQFQDYKHPTYEQVHGDFIPSLSALDLYLMAGKRSATIAFS